MSTMGILTGDDAITDFPCFTLPPATQASGHARAWSPMSDAAIPFTGAPCYPYELASKNKSLGEIDGC
jgi:hypothetical protein